MIFLNNSKFILKNINYLNKLGPKNILVSLEWAKISIFLYDYIVDMCNKSVNKSSRLPKERFCWNVQGVIDIKYNDYVSSTSSFLKAYKKYQIFKITTWMHSMANPQWRETGWSGT